MTYHETVLFRSAGAADAAAIAALHADSWRRHYRGAYSDSFLDGDVLGDRETVWTERFRTQDGGSQTVLAEDDAGLVGFGHVVFDSDARWGALHEARGATRIERARVSAPGGVASRLNAAPHKLRYVWSDPTLLVTSTHPIAQRSPSSARAG